MPRATRSSMRLDMTDKMHKNTRKAKVKLEPFQTPQSQLLLPVDTADGIDFHA